MDTDEKAARSQSSGSGTRRCTSGRLDLSGLTHERLVAYLQHALCDRTTVHPEITGTQ